MLSFINSSPWLSLPIIATASLSDYRMAAELSFSIQNHLLS
jgi:hypothetical protein